MSISARMTEINRIIAGNGFSKVSFAQFSKDMAKIFPYFNNDENLDELKVMYNEIHLPSRATDCSAGYDFYSPFQFVLRPGNTITIPTGIRAEINQTWFLMVCPKSGLGCKFHVRLTNTVGIIDSDYSNADNEGHIFIELEIPSPGYTIPNECFGKDLRTAIYEHKMLIGRGNKFAQGIFLPYGTSENDDSVEKIKRTGGFGSTGK